MVETEEEAADITIVSDQKIKRMRNLKFFRDYTDDQIREWASKRQKGQKPPINPADITTGTPIPPDEAAGMDEEEFKKKTQTYLNKYKKEYGVDMNDSNDAESLRQLVRLIIQLELIDHSILVEQHKKNPNHTALKGYGDFQRSVQQSVNEIQTSLGISRKARKEKQVDDIPEFIAGVRKKALDFWERKTVPIKCERCRIELARYWLNFPDMVQGIRFELTCDKCKEKIIYTS